MQADWAWSLDIQYSDCSQPEFSNKMIKCRGIKNDIYYIAENQYLFSNPDLQIYHEWNLADCSIKLYLSQSMLTDMYYVIQEIYVTIRILISYIIGRHRFSLIHASAVDYHGKGILLIGDKRSGKSTLMTALLKRNCRSIAVDRCYLWECEKQYNLSGWISTNRIGYESLKLSIGEEAMQPFFPMKQNMEKTSIIRLKISSDTLLMILRICLALKPD